MPMKIYLTIRQIQNFETRVLKNTSIFLVGEKGLEPSRLATLVPKTSVSTNSTTRPLFKKYQVHFKSNV